MRRSRSRSRSRPTTYKSVRLLWIACHRLASDDGGAVRIAGRTSRSSPERRDGMWSITTHRWDVRPTWDADGGCRSGCRMARPSTSPTERVCKAESAVVGAGAGAAAADREANGPPALRCSPRDNANSSYVCTARVTSSMYTNLSPRSSISWSVTADLAHLSALPCRAVPYRTVT